MSDRPQDEDDAAIVREAADFFRRVADWEATARARMDADVKFSMGDAYNNYQWMQDAYQDRIAARLPTLTVNKVRTHGLQVINDMRQHKSAMSIRPTGGRATYEAAQMLEGVLRQIEYQSQAHLAYEAAIWWQVFGGIGYWVIRTDYADEMSFDQEIYIDRVADPRMVALDPDIKTYDGSDANQGVILSVMSTEAFRREYPGHEEAAGSNFMAGVVPEYGGRDQTTIATYYRRRSKADTLFMTPSGSLILASEMGSSGLLGQMREAVRRGEARSRPTHTTCIEQFTLAGSEVLDRTIFPGKYIPIVRVVGEETVFDGILDRRGLTRWMIDPQRWYNYMSSSEVAAVSMQTKIPWIAAKEAVEGYEDMYALSAVQTPPVLLYNSRDESGNAVSPPQRQPLPMAAAGYLAGMRVASDEIMQASGQFQSEMGAPGNEKSGVAIERRQRQSDIATAQFPNNFATAIRFTGRILLSMIPVVYDAKRILRVRTTEGTDAEVEIDPEADAAHAVKFADGKAENIGRSVLSASNVAKLTLNPRIGAYGVQADIGDDFGTQRQAAFDAMMKMMAQSPKLFDLFGDLLFDAADFPGASDIAERIKEARKASQVPKEQYEAAAAEIAKLKRMLTDMVAEGAGKIDQADRDAMIRAYQAGTARLSALVRADPVGAAQVGRIMAETMQYDPLPTPAYEQEVDDATGMANIAGGDEATGGTDMPLMEGNSDDSR